MALSYFSGSDGNVLIIGLAADSKPASPGNGWFFLEMDSGKRWTASGGAWVLVFYGWVTVMKTSDQNRTNNTLSNDSALVITLAASTKYHIRGRVYFNTANATMDFKYALAYSGTITNIIAKRSHAVAGAVASTDNENTIAQNSILGSTAVTGTTTGIGYVEIDVVITTNATGTFGFQWAQNTTDGSNLTCMAGSYLEYYVIP